MLHMTTDHRKGEWSGACHVNRQRDIFIEKTSSGTVPDACRTFHDESLQLISWKSLIEFYWQMHLIVLHIIQALVSVEGTGRGMRK